MMTTMTNPYHMLTSAATEDAEGPITPPSNVRRMYEAGIRLTIFLLTLAQNFIWPYLNWAARAVARVSGAAVWAFSIPPRSAHASTRVFRGLHLGMRGFYVSVLLLAGFFIYEAGVLTQQGVITLRGAAQTAPGPDIGNASSTPVSWANITSAVASVGTIPVAQGAWLEGGKAVGSMFGRVSDALISLAVYLGLMVLMMVGTLLSVLAQIDHLIWLAIAIYFSRAVLAASWFRRWLGPALAVLGQPAAGCATAVPRRVKGESMLDYAKRLATHFATALVLYDPNATLASTWGGACRYLDPKQGMPLTWDYVEGPIFPWYTHVNTTCAWISSLPWLPWVPARALVATFFNPAIPAGFGPGIAWSPNNDGTITVTAAGGAPYIMRPCTPYLGRVYVPHWFADTIGTFQLAAADGPYRTYLFVPEYTVARFFGQFFANYFSHDVISIVALQAPRALLSPAFLTVYVASSQEARLAYTVSNDAHGCPIVAFALTGGHSSESVALSVVEAIAARAASMKMAVPNAISMILGEHGANPLLAPQMIALVTHMGASPPADNADMTFVESSMDIIEAKSKSVRIYQCPFQDYASGAFIKTHLNVRMAVKARIEANRTEYNIPREDKVWSIAEELATLILSPHGGTRLIPLNVEETEARLDKPSQKAIAAANVHQLHSAGGAMVGPRQGGGFAKSEVLGLTKTARLITMQSPLGSGLHQASAFTHVVSDAYKALGDAGMNSYAFGRPPRHLRDMMEKFALDAANVAVFETDFTGFDATQSCGVAELFLHFMKHLFAPQYHEYLTSVFAAHEGMGIHFRFPGEETLVVPGSGLGSGWAETTVRNTSENWFVWVTTLYECFTITVREAFRHVCCGGDDGCVFGFPEDSPLRRDLTVGSTTAIVAKLHEVVKRFGFTVKLKVSQPAAGRTIDMLGSTWLGRNSYMQIERFAKSGISLSTVEGISMEQRILDCTGGYALLYPADALAQALSRWGRSSSLSYNAESADGDWMLSERGGGGSPSELGPEPEEEPDEHATWLIHQRACTAMGVDFYHLFQIYEHFRTAAPGSLEGWPEARTVDPKTVLKLKMHLQLGAMLFRAPAYASLPAIEQAEVSAIRKRLKRYKGFTGLGAYADNVSRLRHDGEPVWSEDRAFGDMDPNGATGRRRWLSSMPDYGTDGKPLEHCNDNWLRHQADEVLHALESLVARAKGAGFPQNYDIPECHRGTTRPVWEQHDSALPYDFRGPTYVEGQEAYRKRWPLAPLPPEYRECECGGRGQGPGDLPSPEPPCAWCDVATSRDRRQEMSDEAHARFEATLQRDQKCFPNRMLSAERTARRLPLLAYGTVMPPAHQRQFETDHEQISAFAHAACPGDAVNVLGVGRRILSCTPNSFVMYPGGPPAGYRQVVFFTQIFHDESVHVGASFLPRPLTTSPFVWSRRALRNYLGSRPRLHILIAEKRDCDITCRDRCIKHFDLEPGPLPAGYGSGPSNIAAPVILAELPEFDREVALPSGAPLAREIAAAAAAAEIAPAPVIARAVSRNDRRKASKVRFAVPADATGGGAGRPPPS